MQYHAALSQNLAKLIMFGIFYVGFAYVTGVGGAGIHVLLMGLDDAHTYVVSNRPNVEGVIIAADTRMSAIWTGQYVVMVHTDDIQNVYP